MGSSAVFESRGIFNDIIQLGMKLDNGGKYSHGDALMKSVIKRETRVVQS